MKTATAQTIMQVMKLALDEMYSKVSFPKDDLIKEQITLLYNNYKGLLSCEEDLGFPSLDYSNRATQFAYVYKYVPHHASMVYQIINELPPLRECFNEQKVTVSALGGGPGSELVGIMKFMSDINSTASLRCYLCDKDETWQETWDEIEDHLGRVYNTSIRTRRIDVLDPQNWQRQDNYLKANIITCVYFISEIYCSRDVAIPFFDNLLSAAQEGTFLIFIDNNLPSVYTWFDDLMKTHDWDVLVKDEGMKKIEDRFEQKTDLGEYWDKFGDHQSVKLKAKIAYRVYYKPLIDIPF